MAYTIRKEQDHLAFGSTPDKKSLIKKICYYNNKRIYTNAYITLKMLTTQWD